MQTRQRRNAGGLVGVFQRTVISGVALAFFGMSCWGATTTGGGVSLIVDDDGSVGGVTVMGRPLPCKRQPWLSLCDVTKGTDFVPGKPGDGKQAGGQMLSFGGLDAEARVQISSSGSSLRVTCDLIGKTSALARGVLLRFSLPIDCTDWRWHDDMQTSRAIAPGNRYENVQALRAWPDLPEWTDKPNLRIGSANRNFCTVVTGPVGVCIAPDITRPIIFRTSYDAVGRELQLVYDLALSPDTAPPNRWTVAFDIYACDPEWGFRSALATYYGMYPELFRNYVPRPGQWMAFTDLKYIDNANEFEFGLQEGARDPAYDDRIDVFDCTYFTHAGQFIRIPNHDPEKDPAPPPETILSETEKTFEKRTGLKGVYAEVGLRDATGQFQIPKTRVYGHYIAQFNLDADLRYGKWHLERTAKQTADFAAKGGRLDGFYYDGLTTGLNYRTDHFRFSAAPPLWDPVSNKPVLNNFFSSCEFARSAAELLRPKGQITMMNGALNATFFVAPWLDVFGAETGLRIPRSSFNFIRTIIRHKPMLTLLKGNFEQKIGHDDIELYMKRALAYGVFPGFFDWPPSGLGPGGRYWAHPEYYERDRDLFRKYLPLVKALGSAGWEPVTRARSSADGIYVERYGPDEDGLLWFTLMNEDASSIRTTLSIDSTVLPNGPDGLVLEDAVSGNQISLENSGGALVADITVPPEGVMVLQLGSREQIAGRRLQMAENAVTRGITMRAVDEEYARPPVAVHWRPDKAFYGRASSGDGYVLDLQGNGKETIASQWAMLFQPEPAPVTLRVRASAQELEGGAEVRCRIAWVTSSFTHYDWRNLKLPEGNYDDREFTLEITADKPLRAINVQARVTGQTKGTLRISSISLSDRFGDNYVVDPGFEQWYEPVPLHMRERLRTETQALAAAFASARGISRQGIVQDASRGALTQIVSSIDELRNWIVGEGAENGCRRVLRDVETARRHASAALLSAFEISSPRLSGPDAATPGDTVLLRTVIPGSADIQATAELTASPGIQTMPGDDGLSWRLAVPTDAVPGAVIASEARVTLLYGAQRIALPACHRLQVVSPLTVEVGATTIDSTSGSIRISVCVGNRRDAQTNATVSAKVAGDWHTPVPARLTIAAHAEAEATFICSPAGTIGPGEFTIDVTAVTGTCAAKASRSLVYIPPSANLLKNPGFEEGPWQGGTVDTDTARNGNASLRLSNTSKGSSQVSQTVVLNQTHPCAILVSCASKGVDVSGTEGSGYSLYVDIYYTDGTPLYGRIFPFHTGTTDWQQAELIIEPTKPIRNVNVYLLLRGKAGTVWFDDVALAEDPRRRGNIARDADITVDSCYSQYSTGPLTDGIVHVPADAHWTKESWASADQETDHWVAMSFQNAKSVRGAVIFWSLDGGSAKTSREVCLQAKQGETWQTLTRATPPPGDAVTELSLEKTVTAREFRIFQPCGKGPKGRPNIMWIREIELK